MIFERVKQTRTIKYAYVLFAAFFIVVVVMQYIPTNRQVKSDKNYKVNLARYGAGESTSTVIVDTPDGWVKRNAKAMEQAGNQIKTFDTFGRYFFQNNWEPTVACAYEKRMGRWGDGGKWICDPSEIKGPVLIYSLGSNNDFSFETAMYEWFGKEVEIHTFDFGAPIGKPEFVNYHRWKMAGIDSEEGKSLKTIIKLLKHEDRRINILKIDVEGYEHEVLMAAINDGVFKQIDQLQIEIHLIYDISGSLTKMNPNKVHELFVALNNADMEIFHKELNTIGTNGDACEFSFVKVEWK